MFVILLVYDSSSVSYESGGIEVKKLVVFKAFKSVVYDSSYYDLRLLQTCEK